MSLSAKVFAVIASLVAVTVVGLIVSLFISLSGQGGAYTDSRSYQALQAKTFDAELRSGMTRDDVRSAYDSFRSKAHVQTIQYDCAAGCGGDVREIDWTIDEPQHYPWASYGTTWEVRAFFDARGRLARHDVVTNLCCRPAF